MKKSLVVLAASVWVPLMPLNGEDCLSDGNNEVTTDHFFYAASSDQGAVGDVVAIDFSLTLEDTQLPIKDDLEPHLFGFTLVGCYDHEKLELLSEQRYSEFYDEFSFLSLFYPPGGEAGRPPDHPAGVFLLGGTIRAGAEDRFLSSHQSFPLMTLYFRLTGEPGDILQVRFCDNTLVGFGCSASHLAYTIDHPDIGSLETRSTHHIPGTVQILPGDPTRPDPPPLPPNAKIYPELPTPEKAEIHFELEGPLVARPGATDVPFRLFATSNYEFSGFMSGIQFPAEHLELTHVEEHTRPGVLQTDNDSGGFGLLMANTRRRVGQERERVHLATLYFAVSKTASGEVPLEFEQFETFFNWVAIDHIDGLNTNDLPITAEVTPLFVTNGLLMVQAQTTTLGDVNLDYDVNVADALHLLQTLFLGEHSILCPRAADFNQDESLNLSDPVAILNHLFRGGPPTTLEKDLFCDH